MVAPPPPKGGEEQDTPPDARHMVALPSLPLPTGEVIERPFKDFGYQIYFQDPQSTVEIQENVCPRPPPIRRRGPPALTTR